MLSALSVAEFWRNEAAFLAASRRLRASCLCFSAEAVEELDEKSALFSRPSDGRPLPGFFDAGGAAFSSSCGKQDRQRERAKCEGGKGKDNYKTVRENHKPSSTGSICLGKFDRRGFDKDIMPTVCFS